MKLGGNRESFIIFSCCAILVSIPRVCVMKLWSIESSDPLTLSSPFLYGCAMKSLLIINSMILAAMRAKAGLVFVLLSAGAAFAEDVRPNVLDPSYRHDRFGTLPSDIVREFRAFTTSFDSDDDDDADGRPNILGIPHWVAQEVRRAERAPESSNRPQKWFSDAALSDRRIAPVDASYAYSAEFRRRNPNWFDRGHLAQKYLAERLGPDAAWNTHTVLNAVPQRSRFNSGIWLDLECKTGAWANRFNTIWIISGPVFISGRPTQWIGEKSRNEVPVAVPEALFKVIVRDRSERPGIEVLAFVYPQDHPSYRKRPWDHKPWLTSLEQVERLTGLTFLAHLPISEQKALKHGRAEEIWPHAKDDFDPGCKAFAKDSG